MAGNKGLLPASIDDPFWQQDVEITMPLYLVGRLNDLVTAFMSNPSTEAAAWQLVQARAGGQIPPIIFNKNMIEIQLLLAISLEGPVNEKVKETEALQNAVKADPAIKMVVADWALECRRSKDHLHCWVRQKDGQAKCRYCGKTISKNVADDAFRDFGK